MASTTGMVIDPLAALIAVGVIGVLGLYFWHVLKKFRETFLTFRAIVDTRAARQRANIDGGQPESVMRRTGQILSITLLLILISYVLLRKFGFI